MSEKIFLTYTKASALPYQGSVLGYHIVLNYVDSNGRRYTLQALPEHGFDHNIDKMLAFGREEWDSDGANNRDSPFGRLQARSKETNEDEVSPVQPHTMIVEGNDLSSQWALMRDFAAEVNSIGYEYRPASQNSNSFAGGALQRAGLFGPGTMFPERFDSQLVFDPVSGENRSFKVPGFEKSLANPINTEMPMPFALNAPAAPSIQRNEIRSQDQTESFGDRYGNWASATTGIPSVSSDRPESFVKRFGNWGSVPAGSFGAANSPLLRALENERRAAAPDGPTSVAAAPSLAPSDGSEPGFESQSADKLYVARERAARSLAGVGRYVENGLIPSAQATVPSETPYANPIPDADGSLPPRPIRRLVGEIVDDPRTSAFDRGALAVPFLSNGYLSADRGNLFDDRVRNWTSSGTGITPQQPQDPVPSYSAMLRPYLNEQTAGQAQAPVPYGAASSVDDARVPKLDPTNPPPLFAPSNYSAAPGDDSIQRWIASLAGVDPDDPDRLSTLSMFSQLYRR